MLDAKDAGPSLNKLLPKLARIKSKMESVKKKANNPFFKSKYADLNSHLDLVEPLLEEEGLVLLQPVKSNYNGGNIVTSLIVDVETGQSIESSMSLVGETDMQKAGSAITYARRYTLGSLLAMVAEDDDGEGAVRGKTQQKTVVASSSQKSVGSSTTEGTASNNATKPRASFKKQATVNTGDDI